MQMNFKMVSLAALAVLAGGAQAAVTGSLVAPGNSSVLFVALDANSNTGLVIDLGLNMSDFSNVSSANLPQGSWNFADNTTTFGAVTGNSWSAAYDTFKAAQSGGDFTWGVIAGDSVTGASVTASNAIIGRGVLTTGTPSAANMTSVVNGTSLGNGLGNFNNFVAAAANRGNLAAANNGGAATTSSDASAWQPTLIGDRFGGNIPWSYMLSNGAVSNFQWIQQVTANPVVKQFGDVTTTDSLSATPLTFSFDIATNTLVAAVPEPSTYAMLIAGLAAVGFVARRRRV